MKIYSTEDLENVLDSTKKKLEKEISDAKERELAALYVVMKFGYLTPSGVVERLANHTSKYYDMINFEIGVDRKKYHSLLEEMITELEKEKYGKQYHFISGPSHDYVFEAHNDEKGFFGKVKN